MGVGNPYEHLPGSFMGVFYCFEQSEPGVCLPELDARRGGWGPKRTLCGPRVTTRCNTGQVEVMIRGCKGGIVALRISRLDPRSSWARGGRMRSVPPMGVT